MHGRRMLEAAGVDNGFSVRLLKPICSHTLKGSTDDASQVLM